MILHQYVEDIEEAYHIQEWHSDSILQFSPLVI